MKLPFPYLDVPPEALPIVGEPDIDNRIHRAEGTENEIAAWFDVISEIGGQMVSPGGVGMFAPVSRAAVHKRLKEGRLTVFLFHIKKTKKGLFGKKKTIRESPYGYIPVSEAKAWGQEIEERMVRLGHLTREELEGEKPDWDGKFLNWNDKTRREVSDE